MSGLIYSIVIHIYGFGIKLFSVFHPKAKLWINGRKGLFASLEKLNTENRKVLWFHCASLGEFEQGSPVIDSIHELLTDKKRRSEYFLILTFFSPSGYEMRKNYNAVDSVAYLPLDTKKNCNKFLNIIKPSIAVFVKYEFWWNIISGLNERSVPVFLSSGIFREDHWLFGKYGKFFLDKLKFYKGIYVQDNESFGLLESKGFKNVEVYGDTRLDRVYNLSTSTARIDKVQQFTNGKTVIVFGSIWPEDFEIVKRTIDQYSDQYLFIIAPHDMGAKEIKRITRLSKKQKSVLFSTFNENHDSGANTMILDEMGYLSRTYQYCSMAYIGGGFGKGIHNTLEPAAFGLPIIMGPDYKKFKETVDLVNLKGAFEVKSPTQFMEILHFLNEGGGVERIVAGEICRNYIRSNKGATLRTTKEIVKWL